MTTKGQFFKFGHHWFVFSLDWFRWQNIHFSINWQLSKILKYTIRDKTVVIVWWKSPFFQYKFEWYPLSPLPFTQTQPLRLPLPPIQCWSMAVPTGTTLRWGEGGLAYISFDLWCNLRLRTIKKGMTSSFVANCILRRFQDSHDVPLFFS